MLTNLKGGQTRPPKHTLILSSSATFSLRFPFTLSLYSLFFLLSLLSSSLTPSFLSLLICFFSPPYFLFGYFKILFHSYRLYISVNYSFVKLVIVYKYISLFLQEGGKHKKGMAPRSGRGKTNKAKADKKKKEEKGEILKLFLSFYFIFIFIEFALKIEICVCFFVCMGAQLCLLSLTLP